MSVTRCGDRTLNRCASTCQDAGTYLACWLAGALATDQVQEDGNTQVADMARGTHGWMRQPCTDVISQHRSALENNIYGDGVEDIRRVLCTELTNLCVPDQLVDNGEL